MGNEFTDLAPGTGGTKWILKPGKTDKFAVRIATYLNGWSSDLKAPEGLLPLPNGCSRLENLPVIMLKMNKNGALLASGPGLVIFNAWFGPGATYESVPVPGTNSADLQVPTNEVAALDRVIAEMKISDLDEAHKLQAVGHFFADKFVYSTWQGQDKLASTNGTPLTHFLLDSRSGHCEYFATATVLLLRKLGIPARYAVGYSVHEPNGQGYVVRERDAHAWCLVWNQNLNIWGNFDTTPASWIQVENQNSSVWQWVSDVGSWIRFQIAKFRWGQTNLRQYIFWGLIPVIALLMFQIIFRRRHRKSATVKPNASEGSHWPGLDSEFYQLESRLAARGVPRQPGEPLGDWLERALADSALADLRQPVQELLRLHYRHRFDPLGLDEVSRKSLTAKAKKCLELLTVENQ